MPDALPDTQPTVTHQLTVSTRMDSNYKRDRAVTPIGSASFWNNTRLVCCWCDDRRINIVFWLLWLIWAYWTCCCRCPKQGSTVVVGLWRMFLPLVNISLIMHAPYLFASFSFSSWFLHLKKSWIGVFIWIAKCWMFWIVVFLVFICFNPALLLWYNVTKR